VTFDDVTFDDVTFDFADFADFLWHCTRCCICFVVFFTVPSPMPSRMHPSVSALLDYVRQQSGDSFELFVIKCASLRMRMAMGLCVQCQFANELLHVLVNEARSWDDVTLPEVTPPRFISTSEMLVSWRMV